MTPDDLLQARRNSLLVALLDCAVEIGGGEISVGLPGVAPVTYDRAEAGRIRALSREWFTIRDGLSTATTPLDDRPARAVRASEALVELESHWPAVLALRDTCMGDGFEPLAPSV